MSRLLLDTHVFLWWQSDNPKLTGPGRGAVATADVVFVSSASAWEATIKATLGRLQIPASMEAGVTASAFEKLLISFAHAERAAQLPLHHKDPFDRMLVAQAQCEKLILVTHDRRLRRYDVELLLV